MFENEILVFLLATVVLVFLAVYHQKLSILPAHRWLVVAYIVAWIAWLATNLEHLFWAYIFNILEHLCYLTNAVLLLVWCWLAARKLEVK